MIRCLRRHNKQKARDVATLFVIWKPKHSSTFWQKCHYKENSVLFGNLMANVKNKP